MTTDMYQPTSEDETEWQRQRAEQQAQRETLWRANTLPPIHSLATLHDWVLQDDPRRTPKWRFRVASDFGLEIQPDRWVRLRQRQVATQLAKYAFDCRALFTENIGTGVLSAPCRNLGREGRQYLERKFRIFSGEPQDDQWHLGFGASRCSGWRTGSHDEYTRWADTIRGEAGPRIRAVLTDGTFNRLRPGMMLTLSCLRCGKALTDPVSQARLIGPECAQTSAAALPFVVELGAKA